MKKIGWIFYLLLSSAHAAFLTVPFRISIPTTKPSIQANYAFGAHKIIFCYAITTGNEGIMVWPFKGKLQKPTNLPLFLKTDPAFEGEFADPSGTIKIKNNSPETLDVSCDFAY